MPHVVISVRTDEAERKEFAIIYRKLVQTFNNMFNREISACVTGWNEVFLSMFAPCGVNIR